MTDLERARGIAAQCWCDPETSGIEMDARLAEAFAKRILPVLELLDAMAAALWDARSVLPSAPHTMLAVRCQTCNAIVAVRNALARYDALKAKDPTP